MSEEERDHKLLQKYQNKKTHFRRKHTHRQMQSIRDLDDRLRPLAAKAQVEILAINRQN